MSRQFVICFQAATIVPDKKRADALLLARHKVNGSVGCTPEGGVTGGGYKGEGSLRVNINAIYIGVVVRHYFQASPIPNIPNSQSRIP